MKGYITGFISIGTSEESNVNRKSLVQKPFLSHDSDQLNRVFRGSCIHLSAFDPGVHKGVETNVGDGSQFMGCYIPTKLGKGALRQIVGFDFVVQDHLADGGSRVVVAGNHPLQKALVSEVVGTAAVPVALGTGKEIGQIFR